MMYENTRDGIITEYGEKLSCECSSFGVDQATRNLQLRFIRGLVSDIVDRVAEDPDSFKDEEKS